MNTTAGETGDRRRQVLWWLAVAACALGGFVLRAWNLDFDHRQHLHPDERHWTLTSSALDAAEPPAPHGTVLGPVLDWLDGQRSPADPYRVTDSFVYGPFNLALSRGVAGWLSDGATEGDQPASLVVHALDRVGIPLLDDDGRPRFDDAYQVDLVGRLLGAVADSLAIVFVALAGRRLAGRIAGLGAAVLMATTVLAIQDAHFLGAEPMVSLAAALALWAMISLDRSADRRRALLGGLAVGAAGGAAVAMKSTAAAIPLVVLAGCAGLLIRHRRAADVVRLVAAAVAAFVAVRVLYPSAFEGLGLRPAAHVLDDYRRQRESAASDLPPSIQWAGRVPVLQPLAWLSTFTIGPAATVAAVVGAIGLVRHRGTFGWWRVAVPLAFVAGPFAFVLVTSVTSGRYYASMVPGVAVLGGFGISRLVHRAARVGGHGWARAAAVGAVALVGVAVLWGVAFVHGVYGHPNTRIAATEWIDEHVPDGAVLTVEGWDDGLPLGLPDIDLTRWTHQQLDLFGPDDPAKVARLATQLDGVDYVVESSPRVWRAVERLPARYPSTINFFDGLDDGTLGFERVATFTSPPRLGPFRLDDGWAEEAFSVYDHPEVRIWARVRDVPRDEVLAVLDPGAAATALPVHPLDGHANGTMLHADELAANADLPTYDETFARGHAWWHALGWLVLLALSAAAAFVIMLPVLGRLPDAGAGLAPFAGIAGPAAAIFLIVSWTPIELRWSLVAVVIATWLGLGAWAGWRRRAALADVWRTRRRLLVTVAVAVVAAYAGALLLRASNPDLWHPARGGEKVFELAFLTSVLRTRTLPPPDPWFSGGALNYYYGGWFLASLPARLLRTSPSVALQLVLPLYAAAAAGAAASAAAALAGAKARVRAAVIAPVAVLVLGNLAIAVAWWKRRTGPIDWWGLSRVIPASSSITEFPAWSFLYGDAHPHVMGIAIVLSTIALAVAAYGALVDGTRTAALVLAGLLGTAIALARMTNTWDVVPLGLVVVVTLALALRRARWTLVAAAAGIVAVVVVVVFAPYAWRVEVVDVGVVTATEQTSVASFVQQFGLFAAVGLVAVGAGIRDQRGRLLTAGTVLLVGGGTMVAPDRAVTLLALALAFGMVALAVGRRPVAPPAALLLASGGWIVVAAVDVVTMRDDIGPRMNTIFKYWYVAWQLLALASAVLVAEWLVARAHPVRRRLAVGLTVVGACTALAFWWLATPARLDDRTSAGSLSLDGEAFVDDIEPVGHPLAEDGTFAPADDMALVEWLRANAPGGTVVAEAPGIDYRWTSRVSAFTGLPTPLGFDWHETQQRQAYGAQVRQRFTDMEALYASTSPRVIAELLDRYDVGYVVFGTQELPLATSWSEAALRAHPCLTVVFESGDVWIGEVDRRCAAVTALG